MRDVPSGREPDEETSLAARAAWMYFAGGLTQAEIAQRLNVPTTRAHRLIAKANRDGIVRVFVEGPIGECIELENALAAEYGLAFCLVAPDLEEGALPLKALAQIGATFLRSTLERGEHKTIGIGHGRTLAATINALPTTPAEGVRFVSLFGGLNRRYAANPYDVIHRLAEKTGADAYFMPVPAFANTVEDRAVLLAQPGIADVFAIAREATLLVAGIGEIKDESFLKSSGLVRDEEFDELVASGAVGEVLGHYFDAEGRIVENEVTKRALSIPLGELKGRKLVALSGGAAKVEAMRAVLASGALSGLITDEITARALARR